MSMSFARSPLRDMYQRWRMLKVMEQIEDAHFARRDPANDVEDARERVAEAMKLDPWRDLGGES